MGGRWDESIVCLWMLTHRFVITPKCTHRALIIKPLAPAAFAASAGGVSALACALEQTQSCRGCVRGDGMPG